MGFLACIVFAATCYYSYKEIIAAGGLVFPASSLVFFSPPHTQPLTPSFSFCSFQGSVRSGSAAPAQVAAPAAPQHEVVAVEGENTVPF
jgi:hypothetical protein